MPRTSDFDLDASNVRVRGALYYFHFGHHEKAGPGNGAPQRGVSSGVAVGDALRSYSI